MPQPTEFPARMPLVCMEEQVNRLDYPAPQFMHLQIINYNHLLFRLRILEPGAAIPLRRLQMDKIFSLAEEGRLPRQ